MIEQITGKLIQKSPTYCLVSNSGLGIGIVISINTYQHLGETGETVTLLTHLHVREDVLQLYGFWQEEERQLFRELINVGGIGPRMAISILSGMEVTELTQAIGLGDLAQLTRIPGVGKKTAQRIVLELKDKIGLPQVTDETSPVFVHADSERKKFEEAVSALTTLGYRKVEARKALEKIMRNSSAEMPIDELIKRALKVV